MEKIKPQGAKVNRQIAGVHLTSKIWQTLVAVLGVTFGVSMYIFMNSFMNGVNDTQDSLAFSTLAHVRIYNDDEVRNYNPMDDIYSKDGSLINLRNHKNIQYTEGIKNTSQIISVVEKQPEVIGVTPQLNFSVFFRNGSKKINGSISGVDVIQEDKLFDIASKVIDGDWNELETNKAGIILGSVLAQKLNVKVGENINILTPDGIQKNYSVIGLIETSVKEVDRTRAYMNIITARQLEGKNFDYSSDIQVNLKDREQSHDVVSRLSPQLEYQVESWQNANQQLVAASMLRNIIASTVSLTILLVAGFGIYNIMNMTINEKIREIAILKAMGFSGKDVMRIFLTQAAVIGLIGAVSGVILGYAVSSLIHQVPFKIAGLETLPMGYQAKDFIAAIVFGISITLLAGYFPSRKASRIDPVVIIRG